MERRNAWLSYKEAEETEMEKLAKAYREFLDKGKTERECVAEIVKEAEAAGYESLESKLEKGEKIKAGDKVYAVGMKKIVALFHVGTEELSGGMSILCAHIDSPRLDVKQNPLYEDTDLAYLDTHYYGGVKKYQWVTLPLAMHGVVAKKDGSIVEISIGEDAEDPVLYITDLLIHLSGKQLQKKAAEVIEGEMLDILIGSRPLAELPDDSKKDAVKQNVLKILNEKYGIEEEDFLSAELEIVPAGKARECGLDRSMIAAYGQDDRVCAYTSLLAMLGMDTPKHTSCCLFTDKEEIGSVGATGMQSRFFENAVAELLDAMGCYSDFGLLILAAAIIIYTMIKNILISAVIGVIGEVALIIIYVVKSSIFEGGIQKVLDVFNLSGHFDNFTSNIFDIKGIVYFLSVIAVCLFLTTQSILKRRWN